MARTSRLPRLASCAAALVSALVAVHSGALADAAGSPAWRRLTSMSEGRPPYFALADSRRDRLLILGMDGWDGLMNAWELPLDGPARLRELPADGALHLQWATAAAYDPAGDRVLFLDSYLPAGVLGVLELSPAPRWTTLATTGELPTVLNYGGAAIVDPIHDALVLFHGVGNLPDEGEVHRLDLATGVWTKLSPAGSGPDGRFGMAAAYDSQRHRMLIHGGESYDQAHPLRHDLWALELDGPPAWTPIQLDGPGAQNYTEHNAIYDEPNDRLIVVGGTGAPHYDTRAYAFATGEWSTLAPAGGPGASTRAYAALDRERGRLYVGGGNTPGNSADLGLWALDLSRSTGWSRVFEPDAIEYPLVGAASAWDSRRGRELLWGGRSTLYYSHDYYTTYSTTLSALALGARPVWSGLTSTTPSPGQRQFATMQYDRDGDAAWLFGGTETWITYHMGDAVPYVANWYGDVWKLDLSMAPYWTRIAPDNDGPTGREGHAMVIDPEQRRLLVFGGRDASHTALEDLWSLPLDPPYHWTRLAPAGATPAARVNPVFAFAAPSRRLILAGGTDASGVSLGDAWSFALDGTEGWTPIAAAGTAPLTLGPRPGVWDTTRRRLLVFGEGDALAPAPAQRVWALDVSGAPTWSELAIGGSPTPDRVGATAAFDPTRDRVVLSGGAVGDALDEGRSHSVVLELGSPALTPSVVVPGDPYLEPGIVHRDWSVTPASGFRAVVQRRAKSSGWESLREIEGIVGGEVRFDDTTPLPNMIYYYRLAWSDDVTWSLSTETYVESREAPPPPPPVQFALGLPRPNPARGLLQVPFTPASLDPIRLELIDIAGRVRWRRTELFRTTGTPVGVSQLESLESIDVTSLPSGVYLVRLTQDGVSISRRAVVVR